MLLSGCSTLGPNDNPAVPANYRQLVAASLAEKMDFSKFIKAEISEPGVWDVSYSPVPARPIACSRVTVESTFGPQSYELGYKFVNGRIEEVFNPSAVNPAAGGYVVAALTHSQTCGKLAYGPFPEFAKPQQTVAR